MKRDWLQARTVAELRRLAANAGKTGYSRLKKSELVDLLASASPPTASVEPKTKARLLGLLVEASGLSGLLLSAIALILVPFLAVLASRSAATTLTSASEMAASLAQSVSASNRALDGAASALADVHRTLVSLDSGLEQVDPLLMAVSEFLGGELTETIVTTRSSLISAHDGAQAMDRVLRGLRLLGVRYDPDQPLHESLTDTAASLEPLPAALEEVETALDASRGEIAFIRGDLDSVAEEIDALSQELSDSASGISAYSEQLQELSMNLSNWARRAPFLGAGMALFGILLCTWLFSANLALYAVGRRWRSRGMDLGKPRQQE